MEITGLARERTEQWRARWRDRAETDKALASRSSEDVGAELLWELAAVRAEVLERENGRLQALVHELFDDATVPAVVGAVVTVTDRPGTEHVLQEQAKVGWEVTSLGQGMLGANVGRMIGGVVPGLGPLLGLIQLAGAAGYVLVNRHSRVRTLGRSFLQREADRLAAAEYSYLVQSLNQAWNEARPEVVIAYRDHLRDAVRATKALLAEARRQQNRSGSDASADAATLAAAIAEVDRRAGTVDEALASLRAV